MSVTDRNTAQQRADRIRAFEEEMAVLRTAGVLQLSPEQERAARDHHETLLKEYAQVYDVDRTAESKQLSLGMRIASFLGALALGASAYFLYYRYWGQLTTALQVAVLIGAALGSLALTVWLGARGASSYFTKLAAIVALVCFVLDLAVIGQVFNIAPTDRAFVVWGALALLLAYAYDSPLLLLAGVAWMTVFLASRTAALSGAYWGAWMERPEALILPGVLTLAVSRFVPQRSAQFAAVFRVAGMITLFIPVIWLGTNGSDSYLRVSSSTIEGIYQMIGFLGAAAAIWIGVRRQWAHVVNTGVVMFVILLGYKFYDWWWESMAKWLFFLIVGLAAILLLLVFGRLRRPPAAPAEAAT